MNRDIQHAIRLSLVVLNTTKNNENTSPSDCESSYATPLGYTTPSPPPLDNKSDNDDVFVIASEKRRIGRPAGSRFDFRRPTIQDKW